MTGTAIIVHEAAPPPAVPLDELDAAALNLARASKSPATLRAYAADMTDFVGWCLDQKIDSVPADPRHIARYLASLVQRGLKATTIGRRVAAITYAHRAIGLDNPCGTEIVRSTLIGARNTLGAKPDKKRALTVDLVTKVIRKAKGDDPAAVRDRAMILVCFGAALRRSELVALNVTDVTFKRKGLLIEIRHSKTDQAGEGRKVAIPDGKLKVPDVLRAWIDHLPAAADDGAPLFRSINKGGSLGGRLDPASFARILKARCAAAGLDPAEFSGHSPRRGFATTAGDEGADLRKTAEAMRHAKLETTLGYMEEGDLLRDSVGKLFL